MKRFLKWAGIISLVFLPRLAMANACATVAACATTPCDWNTAGSWTSCGGVVPLSTDTCSIGATHTVILTTDAKACGATTIDGSLIYDEASTGRDANGYRTLTITGDLTINSTGILRMRAGHRLGFNTTATARLLKIQNGGLLDIQGTVVETTIAAFVDADADTDCAAAGTVGRKFTITPAVGIDSAKKTGRVVFQSGKARNRSYEIRLVGASTFAVCTDTADATSGSDTTGGQRLTPHANRAFYCTGAGAPVACCTGANAGATCPVRPVSQHNEPAAYGNSECTAALTPYPCCTGASTGFCIAALPAVGDSIAIVYDAALFQSAGSNGYRIEGDLGVGNSPMPVFQAVNVANTGSPTVNGSNGVEVNAFSGSTKVTDLAYINFHDYKGPVDGWMYRGVRNFKVRWSAFHDVTTVAGQATQTNTNATLAFPQFNGVSSDGVQVVDSTFYRNQGVNLHPNEGAALPAINNKIQRNLFFEGCISNSECFYLQGDALFGGDISLNTAYDLYNLGGTSGASLNAAGVGAAVYDNWIVNSGAGLTGTFYPTDPNSSYQGTGFTHNYISNIKGGALFTGNWYGNLVKNFGLAQTLELGGASLNPIVAKGNFFIGAETAITSSADCTGSNICGRVGIYFQNSTGNTNAKAVTMSDNFIVGLSGTSSGTYTSGRCILFDGANYSGGGAGGINMNYNATIDHMTCDGRGAFVRGVGFSQYPDTVMTGTIRDLVSGFNSNDTYSACTPDAGPVEDFDNVYSLLTAVTAESGGAAGTNCTDSGILTRSPALGYINRLSATRPNYNLAAGSPLLTAGAQPAGSAIGSRAFRFNRSIFTTVWPVLTFDGEQPADVANGVSNADSDGDGVIDLHDNCKRTFNPSQYDSNGNGVGNACGG
jgi:hypothetical protein